MTACIFKENIRHYTDNGSKVFCTFLDLKAAFDKVNHEKPLRKLDAAGLPKNLTNLIQALYENQSSKLMY